MDKTRLPLTVWMEAMFCWRAPPRGRASRSSANGSVYKYRTVWHFAHRIRAMMAENDPVLRGIVEIDENYVVANGVGRVLAYGP
jgi:hypothetical protein